MKNVLGFICTFLLTLSVLQTYSQSISVLENRLKTAKGIDQIKILLDLSEAYMTKDLEKSLKYSEKALSLTKKTKVTPELKAEIFNTLGNVHYYRKDYSKSVKYYEESLDLKMNKASDNEIAKSYYNIALLYEKIGKRSKAENNYERGVDYATKADNVTIQAYCYRNLAFLNEMEGNYKKSSGYMKQYIIIKDLSFSETQDILKTVIDKEKQLREEKEIQVKVLEEDTLKKAQKIDTLNLQKEIAEQEIEISVKNQELQKAEIQRHKMQLYILFGWIVIVIIIGLYILRSYLQKKKVNTLLLYKNAEIRQQKYEIESQNSMLLDQKVRIEQSHRQITDSINYAKRIQKALLRIEKPIEDSFSEYFLYYKPRDIVSGDFYWVNKFKDNIIVVAADCTGHGVPGAFMSMLGISLLNELVLSEGMDNPGLILNALRSRVKMYLKQTGKIDESKDGMDMALIIINTTNLEAKYSGANNPIYIIRENNLMEYKATKNPIGIYLNEQNFRTDEIQLQRGDRVYLFSDGYMDQFGGLNGLKLKSGKFKEMLLSINQKTMEEQKDLLEKAFNIWRGKYDQVDDILILGIKL
jgi:serine phosphatase RsbU (regulator of sigma subunit)